MKRIVSLLLAFVVLAGCLWASAAALKERRKITFWYSSDGAIGDAILDSVEAFNASQSEIEVVPVYQGSYDTALKKIKAAVPAGKGPDVFQIYEMATAYLSNVKWIVPFSDMLEQDPFLSLEDIAGPLRNYYTVDGKLLCLPYNPSSPIMYYNKTAFEAAGVDRVPETFAEIEAIADQLTAVDANPRYAMGLAVYGWFFEALLAGAGYYYTDGENGRAGAATQITYDDNGGGALVMEAWKRLVDNGMCFSFGRDTATPKEAFMDGQVAIIFESTAQLTTITSGSEFEVGCAFLPSVLDQREDRAIVGGGSLWMTRSGDDQRQQDAWTFMKYLASAEAAAQFSMDTGYYAANSAAYEVPAYVEYLEENPNARVALDQLSASELSNLTGSVFTGVNAELRAIWEEGMELYLAGFMSLEDTLKMLAQDSQAALDGYRIP